MEELIQELEKLPMPMANKLLALVEQYGKDQYNKGLTTGWNRAIDISGYGTPPEPSVRNEVRNTPLLTIKSDGYDLSGCSHPLRDMATDATPCEYCGKAGVSYNGVLF